MATTKATVGESILWFDDPRALAITEVGGKNASLAELSQRLGPLGVKVPPGFCITVAGYHALLAENGLVEPITEALSEWKARRWSLQATGAAIRQLVGNAPLPAQVRAEAVAAYRALAAREKSDVVAVAVRSSATAEDLPEASFAGQQESFLNVRGEADLLDAISRCYASLFTDRAIAYRDEHGFDHMKVALSVGVQKMVRSDLACSGVMFTLDTESGFPRVVLITSSWGLGENIVKGTVNPDEILVFKPLLSDAGKRPILRKRKGEKERTMVLGADHAAATINLPTPTDKRAVFSLDDDDALALARWAMVIEDNATKQAGHDTPMDIEWAKDGDTGELFVVQARPETVQARHTSAIVQWSLEEQGTTLVSGRAVGDAIVTAPVCVVKSAADIAGFRPGSILVAEMTDPDWVPAMRVAHGIVTEHGGRTCHAAIIARELGIPAVVGASGALDALKNGDLVTLVCAAGEEGRVAKGALRFHKEERALDAIPATTTKVMLNLADPSAALSWWRLPADGVGLARMEFIIAHDVRVHPMALAAFHRVTDEQAREAIEELTAGYADKTEFFVDKLASGIATLAAVHHPHPVIVRMSDFKTNEYARLVGGEGFEPHEENPMLGFRGASRYDNERYRAGFALECRAIRRVREVIGLDNVSVMIPFCRTIDEADRVLAVMAEEGLRRGERGLAIHVMCEVPANVVLATEFAARFDGFSIGSNDLTQLVLGVDRDSELLAALFDESNPAVLRLIEEVIDRAHAAHRTVGICGEAPSDKPDFAAFLVEHGIDSISLNPDRFLITKARIAEAEQRLRQVSTPVALQAPSPFAPEFQ